MNRPGKYLSTLVLLSIPVLGTGCVPGMTYNVPMPRAVTLSPARDRSPSGPQLASDRPVSSRMLWQTP